MDSIYKKETTSVDYDKETKLMYIATEGKVNPKILKESMLVSMDFVQKEKCVGFITDASKMTGTFTMLNDFMANEYFPHLIKYNVKFAATVLSNDVFSQFSIGQLIKKIKDFEMRMFENYDEAKSWALNKIKQ